MNHNQVTISGRVIASFSHKYEYNEEIYAVCWLESAYIRKNRISKSVVRISVPERLTSQIDIAVGDYIQIEGSLINTYHDMKADIAVLAHKISYSDPGEIPVNSVSLSGTVRRILTDDSNFSSFVKFIISAKESDDSDRYITVRVTAWGKLAYRLYDTLDVGDPISAAGSLNSITEGEGILRGEMFCTSAELVNREDILKPEDLARLFADGPRAASDY